MAGIQHVFVLMLENRSYDNVFGWSNLTGKTPAREATTANGLPSAPIVNFGRIISSPCHLSSPTIL